MRIKILADVAEGLTLPVNYNHLLTGVIYRFLTESDPEYASFLHNEGYLAAEKHFKLFTFSQLMAERRRITGDKIYFRSTLTWYISSPVERFLSHFADTLLSEGRLSLGHRHLQVRDVTVPRIPRFQSEMHFRCLSPIVMSTVREWDGKQSTHYCMPDDPALSELIHQNLMRKYEAIHDRAPHDDTFNIPFRHRLYQQTTRTRHTSRRLQRHQDKRGNVSIPCLGEYSVDPNRLRMRFRRQKQCRFSAWQKSKYTTITF